MGALAKSGLILFIRTFGGLATFASSCWDGESFDWRYCADIQNSAASHFFCTNLVRFVTTVHKKVSALTRQLGAANRMAY